MTTPPHPAITIGVAGDQVVIDSTARVCVRCVLPETFPGLAFDADGVCTYCSDEQERVDGDRRLLDRAIEEALRVADPHRDHDCIMLYSGGKDSSLALVELVETYGLRVLAFTLDNAFMSQAAVRNSRRVLDGLGVDHVVLRPATKLMHAVYRVSIVTPFGDDTTKYSTASCGSCISLVIGAGLRLASDRSVPLLAGGWTPGQLTTSPCLDPSFLVDLVERHLEVVVGHAPDLGSGLRAYRARPNASQVRLINPLYTSEASEEETLGELARRGWSAPRDTDSCSTNCRLNGLLVLEHSMRHGYHPYVYELAHHVRLGRVAREDALKRMRAVSVTPTHIQSVARELGVPSPV